MAKLITQISGLNFKRNGKKARRGWQVASGSKMTDEELKLQQL